ncbi:hypothetical protein F4801DRAFT_336708 [Xylaria longipes]|nr:hypothetical protein F4801DRAFT_336708 [Xylaria longipes]
MHVLTRVPKTRYNVPGYHSNQQRPGSVISEYGYFLDRDCDLGALDTSVFPMARKVESVRTPLQALIWAGCRHLLLREDLSPSARLRRLLDIYKTCMRLPLLCGLRITTLVLVVRVPEGPRGEPHDRKHGSVARESLDSEKLVGEERTLMCILGVVTTIGMTYR